MTRPFKKLLSWLVHPLFLGVLVATGVTQLRASRSYEVAKPSENIRTAPEGRHIGTLLQGATIEEAGRDGRWVKFQLEAWIWGPSLEGFESGDNSGPALRDASSPKDAAAGASTSGDAAAEKNQRKPRVAVNANVDAVRELIDDKFGRFYGMRRDSDLSQLQIRFRVKEIEPEALDRRHMGVQYGVLKLLQDDIEFDSIRVETNRADGSGEVGAMQAVTSVEDIRRLQAGDLGKWRQVTRRSSDGGKTWSGPE